MLPAGSEELVQGKYIRPDCRVLVLPAGSEELVQGKYISKYIRLPSISACRMHLSPSVFEITLPLRFLIEHF